MTGRIIDDDLLGVVRRIQAIDPLYFVFLNYVTGRFEVRHKDSPQSPELVLPYDTLDERAVRRVRFTRAERREQLIEYMERQNSLVQRGFAAKELDL